MRPHCLATIIGLLLTRLALAGQPLVIHEWGTFTSLQNEWGDAIGGINVDTERLPRFVHNFAPAVLPNMPDPLVKGLPTVKPRLDVTMRLETPVVYFHLPPDAHRPIRLDLTVRFRNGWLTQYYPDAEADIDGRPVRKQVLGPILPDAKARISGKPATSGGLSWRSLQVGTDLTGPVTESRVWLAPRAVRADRVSNPKGESEQYLFYRGVGHLDAPLRVSRAKDGTLEIHGQLDAEIAHTARMISHLWLVDVRSDGMLAFRTLAPLDLAPTAAPPRVSASFETAEYAISSLTSLQQALKKALVADGLFDDEAEALLNTWETSYFHEKGLRLFFLVPRAWTDAHLPLTVSSPSTIQRIMMGRIEIVTPEQRKTLQELASVSTNLPDKDCFRTCTRIYRNLGRFAQALLLDEQATRPKDGLQAYIRGAGLAPDARPAQQQASAGK